MNFNLAVTTNSNAQQFIKKINTNGPYLNQQQFTPRLTALNNNMSVINGNNFVSPSYSISSNNNNNTQNNKASLVNNNNTSNTSNNNTSKSLSLNYQFQDPNNIESFNPQRNYTLQASSANNMTNSMNLNYTNMNTNNNNLQQQINAPALIASVIAANTTCSLNNTLFVGNLHASLQEIDLIQVFRPFGRIVECCKKWLHFGFVKFTSEEEACHAYVTLNGFRLKGRPMRLEFQNRTKKARIKAILAQAALQASSSSSVNCNNETVKSSLANLGFSNLFCDNFSISGNSTSSTCSTSLNNLNTNIESTLPNDCSLFDPDQLIKFANSLDSDFELKSSSSSNTYLDIDLSKKVMDTMNNLSIKLVEKKMDTIKETKVDMANSSEDFMVNTIKTTTKSTATTTTLISDSPPHDISCSQSSSSDFRCNSNSFSLEEDSGFSSLRSSKSSKIDGSTTKLKSFIQSSCESLDSEENLLLKKNIDDKPYENDENLSEVNDGDDDDDDCESNSDTSDDASDIQSDAEFLNDLELLDENFVINENETYDFIELKGLNQVVEKDGSIVRKKLNHGIYCSINQTFSLFIEPQDILKPMDTNDFDEYLLFPNEIDKSDSYYLIKNQVFII